MTIKFRTLPVIAFAVLAASVSFAGPSTDSAVQKLKNVINNSLPSGSVGAIDRVIKVENDLDRLEKSLKGLEEYNESFIPERQRAPIRAKIADLRAAIGKELGGAVVVAPPVESKAGFYCTAGCQDFTGKAMPNTMKGGRGENILVAKFNARQAVLESYRCTVGAVDVACEEASADSNKWTCEAGCVDFTGSVMPNTLSLGKGATKLEAILSASNTSNNTYHCTVGMKERACLSK